MVTEQQSYHVYLPPKVQLLAHETLYLARYTSGEWSFELIQQMSCPISEL